MKHSRPLLLLIVHTFICFGYLTAQAPQSYYTSAYQQSRFELKTALHQIIKTAQVPTYAAIWQAYSSTDRNPQGFIWDMYSNCTYSYSNDQCGTSRVECDCYNREHAFPKSWFGDIAPMNCDLHHVIPSDGYVNGRRSNYPYGEVKNPTYVSGNGSKLGPSQNKGYSGTVFEPIDEYKGDLARIYFYMATCYESQVPSWSSPMLDGSVQQVFSDWALRLLVQWSGQDPVSDKEIIRNNAIYAIQGNRNPFVDYPDLVEKIWGGDTSAFLGHNPSVISDPALKIRYTIHDTHTQIRYGEINLGLLAAEADVTELISSLRHTVHTSKTHEDLILLSEFSGNKPYADNNPELAIDQLPRYKEKSKVFPAADSIKLGTSSQVGYLITEDLDASLGGGRFVVEIAAKGWASSGAEIQVECASESRLMSFNANRYQACQSQRVVFENGASNTRLKIGSTANKTRCFIDYIKVYAELDSSQNVSVSTDTIDFGLTLPQESRSRTLNVRVFTLDEPIRLRCTSDAFTVSPNTLSTVGAHSVTLTYRSDQVQDVRALLEFSGSKNPLAVPLKARTVSELPRSPKLAITSPLEGHCFTDSIFDFAFTAVDVASLSSIGPLVTDTTVRIRPLVNGSYRMIAGLYIHDTVIPLSQDTLHFTVAREVSLKSAQTSMPWCYPNPARDRVSFVIERPAELRVFTIDGREYHRKYYPAGTHELSVFAWPSGAYLFRLSGKEERTQTIMINSK